MARWKAIGSVSCLAVSLLALTAVVSTKARTGAKPAPIKVAWQHRIVASMTLRLSACRRLDDVVAATHTGLEQDDTEYPGLPTRRVHSFLRQACPGGNTQRLLLVSILRSSGAFIWYQKSKSRLSSMISRP